MAQLTASRTTAAEKTAPAPQTLRRIGRYILLRLITLLVSVTVGVYITILVANMGGFIDTIYRGIVADRLMGMEMGGAWDHIVDIEERHRQIEETRYQMEKDLGVHDPFLPRTFRYLWNNMTLGLGEAYTFGHGSGFAMQGSFMGVRALILERLPYTVLLFGAANLLTFIAGLFLALILSRRTGGLVDRVMIVSSALFSAPAWIHGAILIIVLASWLHWLPFPAEINLAFERNFDWFVRQVLPQLAYPVLAIFLSSIFATVYAWRTYFLIYANEDYVDMAKAKGLPARIVERLYILRPSLPYVLTNFALMMVTLWQGSLAVELLFNWPGVGLLFLRAVRTNQVALIIGVVVIFAYLLALTIFLLDLVIAMIDPRVSAGGDKAENRLGRAARLGRRLMSKPSRSERAFRAPAAPRSRLNLRPGAMLVGMRLAWQQLRPTLGELRRYPSAIVGLALIAALVGLAVFTVIDMPYQRALVAWRGHETDWFRNPRYAKPAWINLFRKDKLPVSVFLDSSDPAVERVVTPIDDDMREIAYTFPLNYEYSVVPQDFFVNAQVAYIEKLPLISMEWVRPDGEVIDLGQFSPRISGVHYPLADERVKRRLRGQTVLEGMFGGSKPLAGDYELKVFAYVFEDSADVQMEMILQGYVHGLAGTDQNRRDILFAVQWGAVVALSFGLLGAVATNLISMLLAAAGVWLGGWVDGLVQRLTEVMMILPVLPVAIMVYYLYSKSIWMILGVVVLLTIFSTTLRNYRAAFLQIKNAPYIESAQAYGAGSGRIIFQYLVPRILPVLAPQLVIMVPAYIYYEATLAYLGVTDPYLPTWGKVIYQALTNNALETHPHWLLIPLGFMVLSSLGFALLGFALDKMLNPRLREG